MYVEPMGQMAVVKPIAMPEVEKVYRAESMDGGADYHVEESNTNQKVVDNSNSSKEASSVETDKIKKALEKMNVQLPNAEAKFGIHEATNRVMIKLVDKDTQEVIKEFPPEKTLDMLAKCMEIAGVLVDEKL